MTRRPDGSREILRAIDQRQREILEDLERLNERILQLIAANSVARETPDDPATDSLESAA